MFTSKIFLQIREFRLDDGQKLVFPDRHLPFSSQQEKQQKVLNLLKVSN